ncbi:MAG: hypothetical protein L0H79_00835 [Intrasporangium sp.]|uniref:sensor histidine kinase n=1 Tax=Intrasporangium sp. TaxID=1925024 RepID=UPI0026479081|nr:hypothetical protein [Intrasporangium sp.]MDN5794279.1 hypothetical protein [Intrasporangium sp.]
MPEHVTPLPSGDIRGSARTVPSATQRAERGIALLAPAVRGVVLVQIILAAMANVRVSAHPIGYVALTVAVVAVSVLAMLQCLALRSVRRGAWHVPDLALAWLALPAMNLLMPGHVVGDWGSWATGYAINVAALSASWLPPTVVVSTSLGLAAWCFTWKLASGEGSWPSLLTDSLTIPGYAIVVALLLHYLRGLAADVDQAREDAVAATRALELQRYQLTVHDATSVLRLLSDEETPVEVLPGLRRQADLEARRLRTYLGEPAPRPTDDGQRTVGTMVAAAVQGFEDLPLELAIELGAQVPLPDQVWAATGGAVTTVLHNVRLHAEARQVVVHADTDGSTWEVVVSDDGVGFDQDRQPLGFGLNTQVREVLSGLDVRTRIESAPGRGTTVTMVGRLTTPAPEQTTEPQRGGTHRRG